MKDIEIQTKIIDLDGIEKLRQEGRLSCDNIVFWVGSGIDSIAPTNLPRAAELLGSIMTKACGDSAEKILSLWSNAKAEIDRLDISQNEFSPLSEGKIFIFCGYSGSDSFDVNRYFLGRESERFNSTGVFVRHTRKDRVPPVPSHAREKEQILLQIFQKRYILAADTSDFLSLFGDLPKNLQYDKEPDFDWKTRSNGIYYPAIYHKNFCIQLCSFLGIDASLILGKSWIPSPEEQEAYLPWYTSHPCFTMARLRDDHEQIRFWGNKLKWVENENADNIDNQIDESLQSFDDYSYAKIGTIAEDTCSRRSGVGWECSTYINQCTNYLINKVLLCKTAEELKEVKCQYYKGAEMLIKACISIIDGGYDKIVEMNQLHVALRDAPMLISVFTSDFEKAYSFLQQSTYYYVEISSIDGILGNLNSTQLIDFFHYLYNKGAAYRPDDLYTKITRLCDIVGFKRHENVAKRMKGFIDLMLMVSSSGVTATP